jgi:GNAT superfamily N-acetyltransferase
MKAGLIRPNASEENMEITVYPLTPDRWPDLEKLFGLKGAAEGCWCMYWRLPNKQFEQGSGEGNRAAFHNLVEGGAQTGLMAYDDDEPVGWCAVAPRADYLRLKNSKVLAPVDEQPVWSIPCFFTHKKYRRKGISVLLIRAAIEYARQQGAHILEAYPIAPHKERAPDAFVYTGLLKAFQDAGFVEVERRSETRPIVRYTLKIE